MRIFSILKLKNVASKSGHLFSTTRQTKPDLNICLVKAAKMRSSPSFATLN
jgi:hypothetical protein